MSLLSLLSLFAKSVCNITITVGAAAGSFLMENTAGAVGLYIMTIAIYALAARALKTPCK